MTVIHVSTWLNGIASFRHHHSFDPVFPAQTHGLRALSEACMQAPEPILFPRYIRVQTPVATSRRYKSAELGACRHGNIKYLDPGVTRVFFPDKTNIKICYAVAHEICYWWGNFSSFEEEMGGPSRDVFCMSGIWLLVRFTLMGSDHCFCNLASKEPDVLYRCKGDKHVWSIPIHGQDKKLSHHQQYRFSKDPFCT